MAKFNLMIYQDEILTQVSNQEEEKEEKTEGAEEEKKEETE